VKRIAESLWNKENNYDACGRMTLIGTFVKDYNGILRTRVMEKSV
jgi:hypothetical protein